MKVKVLREVEVDARTIQVSAHIRYWEDGVVNGEDDIDIEGCEDAKPKMPLAQKISGEWFWMPEIEIETGRILNWPEGTTASIHYKVCDEFGCTVYDVDNEVVKDYEGYVESFMCPKQAGYGDYIIMDIDSDGFIDGWSKWDVADFLTRNEEDY